jgi:predicted RNA-binding protein
MTQYWIAVASKEHVLRGVKGGFCQVCHGKDAHLKKMKPKDFLIYYSPKERFEEKEPCQKFTAIGQILPNDPYQFKMSEDFIPWRRDVIFYPCKEVEIGPLIDSLSFIKNKERWGFPFMRGCVKVNLSDFLLIATKMDLDEKKLG